MKIIKAFLLLIRWPNLFFIALTQCIYYLAVFLPIEGKNYLSFFSDINFFLLTLASVFIAAGGYVINDYFDVMIDAVNKPERLLLGPVIKKRAAILWHWLFSFAGLALTTWGCFSTGKWLILGLNFISVLLLWAYSTRFKKSLLIGNVLVSLLTSWVILVMYIYFSKGWDSRFVWVQNRSEAFDAKLFFKWTIIYAGFAFVANLVREVIKDLEDMEGDRQFGAKTMAIVWGVPVSKIFAAVWMLVTILALFILCLYTWQLGTWLWCIYIFLTIVIPLTFLIKKLKKATSAADYHQLSVWLKWIILFGILSMLLINF